MEDVDKWGDLSRWERKTKQKVYSRSQRVTSTDDIYDWIQKVEEASDRATDAAFGLIPPGKQRAKAAVEHRAGLVRNHEQAHTEAQELLTRWVNEKIQLDVDDGFDDLDAWRRAREAKNSNRDTVEKAIEDGQDFSLERLTKLVLEDDIELDETAIYERVKKNAVGDVDPYANLYDLDEKDATGIVLQKMLSKELIKDSFKKDLGFNDNSQHHDPRTKMELRHNMVKETREKRQKQEERKKTEIQMKKEARLKAQQLILKEQKDRETRARKEEMALKKEMAKIRKEMHEERTRKSEEMKKSREEKETLDRLAEEELQRQMMVEEKQVAEVQRLQTDRRRKQIIKMEMVKTKIASANLQCLHKHLTAWYDLVLSKRLLLGKIKAMCDWKLMLKVWGVWRSHVRRQRLELETEVHERNVINTERKNLAAERHYTHSVLRRCLLAWRQFVIELIERKELEKEQERTKSKMASLLSAVANWKREDKEQLTEDSQGGHVAAGKNMTSVKPLQPSMDGGNVPARKQAWVDEDLVLSSLSEICVNETASSDIQKMSSHSKSKGRSLPTQPWQLHKGHLKVSKTNTSVQQMHTDVEIRKKFGTQPWMNRHFVVNNLEHRFTAQQQTLREQQDQIREQRRLIEELQHQQRHQVWKQQLRQDSNFRLISPCSAEIEVPPLGNQIPRGDNAEQQFIGTSKGDNHKLDDATQVVPNPASAQMDAVSNKNTDVNTFRSEPSSSRTNGSSIQTSVAIVKVNNTKYLKVLKNMEERAAQRAKLKAEREERKRQQEEEKLAQLQKVEEETQRTIESERKAKIEAYRQKKRLDKQKEEEKRKELSHLEEMSRLAEDHYRRSLLKYRGLLPFKKMISLSKRRWTMAVTHRQRGVARQCFHAWRLFTDEEISRKQSMADKMFQVLVIKHCFQKWRNYKHHMRFLVQRAERHYENNLREKCFLAWMEWKIREKGETERKAEMAGSHFVKALIRKTFLSWRYLPEKLQQEQEREKRRMELRQKVAELIPDFSPIAANFMTESGDLASSSC